MPDFISKIKLPNDETNYNIKSHITQGILYGEVGSTSTTTNIVATVSDLTTSSYYDGLTVLLKNGVVNAGSVFTLNINNLGAKEVKNNSVSANGNSLFANGSAMIFVYSSTAATNGAWYCYHGVDNVSGMYYVAGSGSTASKTSSPYYAARWRGTNSAITSLYTGLCIYYKLDVAGNGSYGTVLDINTLGEHPVVANVNTMVGTRYAVNSIIQLVYDAAQTANVYLNSSSATTVTGCWKIADYDSNTITQTAIRDFVVGKNAGALYRYQICLVDENDGLVPFNNVSNAASNYTKATNTAPFDPFRGMYWYGTTTTVNAGAGASIGSNTMYLVYQQDARYSFNLNSGVSSNSVAANNGATVFSTSYKYAVGAYCTYLGELYKCKTAITTAGAWDASKWTKISYYSSTTAYAVNAECIRSGYVWKCTTAIGSGGEAWNSAHWTLTTMTGMISSYPVYIKAKYNKTTHLATLVGDTSSASYLVRSSITHGLPEENPNTGLAANEMYIYIFVGRSYTCYNVGMFAVHPIYYWNEVAGKATIFSGAEDALPSVSSTDNGKLLTVVNGEWAPATKPSYTASEVGALPSNTTYVSTVNGQSGAVTVATPGTLNTTATTAQSTSSSEALSGNITLHKVTKTGSYNDLLNKPTIPTVNNATLTIQKNGSTVNTFTANASSNVTANITVPTKTSDLTNDGDDGTHSFLATNDVIPLDNGGTGIAVADADWYSSDTLHPRFEVFYDVDDGGFFVQYAGPLDEISTIGDFRSSEYFKAAIRSLVPMWVGYFRVVFLGTAMVMTGFLAEADIDKIYILFPDAVSYHGSYVNGLKGTLVYDENDGVYMLPSSMQPIQPGWYSSLSTLSNSISSVGYSGDYNDLLNQPTLGTAAAKDTTNTYSSTGTDPITGTGVAAALATLPTPMQFKGTVGSSGTIEWSALPTAAADNAGYVYKVISDHSTAPICKNGDTIVSNGSSWVVIPSGDEPSGTVTNVAISNGGAISVSGSPITSSGTITISHADTSTQASVDNSGLTFIQDVTLDTYGHVTGLGSKTIAKTDITGLGIPGSDTNTTYSLTVNGTGDNANKLGLTAGGSGSGTVWVTVPYATTAGSAPSEFVFTDFTVGA